MSVLSTRRKWFDICCGVCITIFATSVHALDWSWQLERSDLYDSVISISRDNGLLTNHEFACDLSDALITESAEPAATVDSVVTQSSPRGVLIVSCFVGAHSEQLVIIDPMNDKQTRVFEIVGSYFVDWSIDAGRVLIRYDRPCESTNVCDIPFITVEQQWP